MLSEQKEDITESFVGNKGRNHEGIQSSDVITFLQRSNGLTSGEWNKRRISELIQNASLVGEQTKDGDVNRVAEGRTFCDTQAQKDRRKNIQHNCHFDQSHLRFCIEILLLRFLKHNNTLL